MPLSNIPPEIVRRAAKVIYPEANKPTWNRQVIKSTQAAISYVPGLGWCSCIFAKRYSDNIEMKPPVTIERVRVFNNQAIEDELPHLGALRVFMFATSPRIGEFSRLQWGNV